jgi:hypothetical protein
MKDWTKRLKSWAEENGVMEKFGNWENLKNLEELYLFENELKKLPPEIGNLTNLKLLSLSNNKLKKLPPEIGNLRTLGILSLSNNKLKRLPPEVGNLTNLEIVSLFNNKLKKLPPEIENLQKLQVIDYDLEELQYNPLHRNENESVTNFFIRAGYKIGQQKVKPLKVSEKVWIKTSDFQAEIERLEREIEALKKRKGEIPSFSFSKIKFEDLRNLFEIKQELDDSKFDFWFNSKIEISDEVENFLNELLSKNRNLLKKYSEEDLKVHFLSPLFYRIDFKSFEKNFRDFYNEKIRYETEKFIFNGEVDFVLADGIFESQKPYFFIQEFKKSVEFSNPEPQLLAEMVAGLEISKVSEFRGAYIVGSIWNFVILEKLAENQYQYFVSENFDSSKIDDLKAIYKNLVFVKNEILKKV